MEEKTEEATTKWNVGTDPGWEIETESRDEGSH